MRVKERVNERGLRRNIIKEKSKLSHGGDLFVREVTGLFKMLDEEIREIDKLIKLSGKRRRRRGKRRV